MRKPEAGGRAAAIALIGIGWYFAVCIVGGVVGGLLLDRWVETRPVFTILGLFLGLALAAYGAFKALMRVVGTTGTVKGPDED